ncbi:siderophore-interacting protein [Jatrophihabitans sp. DSM 45814]
MTKSDIDRPRARKARNPLATSVRSVTRLSASLVRVVVGGGDLTRFEPSPYADSYVKLMFLSDETTYERPIDVEAIRSTHPAEHWPRLRTYTVRNWNAREHELTLDIVVHGDSGLAGPWAAAVAPGDEVFLLGPGGGYSPTLDADWHLLVGDESALPAIAVALERLPDDAVAHVFVEVHGPQDEVPLVLPSSSSVTWIHRGEQPVGQRLVAAVTTAFDDASGQALPTGDVQAFVHGEAGMVRQLRRLLKVEQKVPSDRLSISGYWRVGADDEGWRATKSEWNRSVEQDEAAELGPAELRA